MEHFKIILKGNDGNCYFYEIEGEEVLRIKGHRFFVHRYIFGEKREWRVTCACSGSAVGWGPFYDDAVNMARKKLFHNFEIYISKLKDRPRGKWRRPANNQ